MNKLLIDGFIYNIIQAKQGQPRELNLESRASYRKHEEVRYITTALSSESHFGLSSFNPYYEHPFNCLSVCAWWVFSQLGSKGMKSRESCLIWKS
jgi:hypothetical protein